MENQNNNQNVDLYEFVAIPSQPGFEVNRIGQVRKVGKNFVKKLTVRNDGYVQTRCNGRICSVHRLVAEVFIPNPNNLREIDHINNNRTDNNYLNLRWTTRSKNCFNKRYGNEVAEIPREATRIDFIKGCDFEDLFYYDQCFYVNYEYKIRCYRGTAYGKQRKWWIYDVNNNQVKFSTKQFLEYWPQFRSDFYPENE